MAKDFEKDEWPPFVTQRCAGKYPLNEDIDHLTYLQKRPPSSRMMTTWGIGDSSALPADILSPGCAKKSIIAGATIMTFPITGALCGWAVIAMLRDAWALKGFRAGIRGSGVIPGKFSSA